MAARSDFAQKLLDDLRLRKERMGMPTSGQHSTRVPSTGNAHGEATRNRPSNTEAAKMWLGTRHHRPDSFEGTSHDIVPIGRTRNGEKGIDVSMALALSLSNTGKLQNIELYSNDGLGNKHVMHRGQLNLREMKGNMPRTSDQFPFLSALQIGGISKGIQHLSTILRACSNGVIINKNAIDIGRGLLKGVMDLEESIGMLASLEDASNYMSGSKGKQIMLLKGKEDETSSEERNNGKLMRPWFSFDRPSKQTCNHVRDGSDYNLMEYKETGPVSNSIMISSTSSLKCNYYSQSLSTDPCSKPAAQLVGHANTNTRGKEITNFSKDVNCPASTNIKYPSSKDGFARERVRIPNVVAKLMGLEELPPAMPEVKKIEVRNDPNLKQVKGSSKTKIDAETSQTTLSTPKMKEIHTKKGIVGRKEVISIESNNGKLKKNMKELNTPPVYSKVHHFGISKVTDMVSMDHCKEFKMVKKEALETRKISTMQPMSEKNIEQGADAKQTFALEYGVSDDRHRKHANAQRNMDAILQQQRTAQEENSIVVQQQPQIDRFKIKQKKQKNQGNTEQNKRNKMHSIVAKKKDAIVKNEELSSTDMKTQKVASCASTTTVTRSLVNKANIMQPDEYQKVDRNEQNKLEKRNSAYHGVEGKLENELLEETRPLKEKEATILPVSAPAMRKHIINPPAQKVEVRKLMRGENEREKKLIEENRRMKTTREKEQMKQQASFLNELEHRWKERTGKVEVIVTSNEMKSEHCSEKTITPASLLCSSSKSENPGLQDHIVIAEMNVKAQQEEPANPIQNDDIAIRGSTDVNPQEVSDKEILEMQALCDENKSEGPADRRQLSNSNTLGWQSIETSDDRQWLLAEEEYNLKQILMSSQHFLNAARTLFKIKIPINALQDTENLGKNEINKLVQDTGCELIRRKARREEAIFSKKMSLAPAKVRCLDDIIKELTDDLCSLELSSETEDAEIAKHLNKQIEKDIENKNPDANCMWDTCWNSKIFGITEKEEIIRDVEKHLLNVLISDLAIVFMSISTNV